jgi:F0F1-type ATP synthase membrane subunit b/b'
LTLNAREASSVRLNDARAQADLLVSHAREEVERTERQIASRTEANLARLTEDRERSINEAERMLAGPTEQRAAATQRLLEAQEQASTILAHADEYVEVLNAGAKEEADSILAAANTEARETMDSALTQAAEHRRQAQLTIDKLQVQRQALDNYLSRLRRLVSRNLGRNS